MSVWTENFVNKKFHITKNYGVFMKDMTKPVTFDDEESLKKYIENVYDEVLFIKFREDDEYKLFGSDKKHFETIKYFKRKKISNNIWFPIFAIIIGISFIIFSSDSNFAKALRFWVLILGVLPLVSYFFDWFSLKRGKNDYNKFIDNNIFNYWLEYSKNKWYIYILPTLLIAVFVIQFVISFTDYTKIEDLFALVKSRTLDGEYWRILTAAFLHANFIHISSNVSSLYFLSKIFLKFYNFFSLLLIFVFTAIIGNLFSIIFYPTATSLGASGGICGILGFIIIFAYKNRNIIPLDFFKNMLFSIVFLVILGIIGYDFIDNAAHFGGLISGIALGYIIKNNKNFESKIRESLKKLK